MRHIQTVDHSAFPAGQFATQTLAGPETGIESCVTYYATVPPGAAGPSRQSHDGDEVYYVLEGNLNVQLGDEEVAAGPDTLVFIPKGLLHHQWNAGAETVRFLGLQTPAPASEPAPAKPSDIHQLVRPLAETPMVRGRPEVFEGEPYKVARLLNRESGATSMAVMVLEVPYGTAVRRHIHPFDQLYFVLDGTLSVEIGVETHQAGRDSLVILPAAIVHTNFTPGPGPERHLAVIVPEPLPDSGRAEYAVALS